MRLNLQSGAVTPQRPDRAALAAPLTGRAVRLAASAALAGVPQPQFVSADGRYVVEEPAQIRGVDLKTGNTLWVAPIRDIVDRTSPPL